MLTNKKILISGGCGFIGSHLVERLHAKNQITVVDNLHSANDTRLSGVKYVYSDIQSYLTEKPEAYDYFFHLGEYARVEQSLDEFSTVMKLNGGIETILEYVRETNCKLIYSGSSTKFYDNGNGECLSPYTFIKAQNSKLVQAYANWYDIEFAICYFYNVYGGREIGVGKYATVISKFINAAKLKQKEVVITSPGTQLRNFTHINDTVNALELIAEKGYGDGYCIAGQESHSIIEIANLLKLPFKIGERNKANRLNGVVDNAKLVGLGWAPEENLTEYLEYALEDCS